MPYSASPALKKFAQRLIAHEGNGPSSEKVARTFRIFEGLREPLVQLAGLGGFRSLLARSVALASGDVPWLRGMQVRADGSLEGLEERQASLSAEDIALGEVAVAVRFIGLLVTFIGPSLTVQLLKDIWPKMDELVV